MLQTTENNYEIIELQHNQTNHNEIDFVLISDSTKTEYADDRDAFENNLKKIGLKLEELNGNDKCRVIAIYATKEILLQYCEILKLKMPLNIKFNDKVIKEQFSRSKNYLFDIESNDFIKPSEKYLIINYILEYTNDNSITKLINKGAYEAAYPLHDENIRSDLLNNWASVTQCLKLQPVKQIKDYFGSKIALYFYWIDFYSLMLFPASVIGVLYMLYGIISLSKCQEVEEICSGNKTYIMCPQCDKDCNFSNIKEYCSHAQLTHILDNWLSIFFTIIISVGCMVYLNLWNSWSAELVHDWGVRDDHLLDYELPAYNNHKKSSKTKKRFKKLPQIMLSYSVILFWIFIVLGVLLGLMFYRISLSASESLHGKTKSVVVEVTGGFFDLISILILNEIYDRIAIWLTKREMHRTQKQYEESLMWKLYIFWFINYYSSFFYIAFFKNRFVGPPSQYNRIFGYRQEECGPGNCIADLFIQIAVVLIGDMTYNNIVEYLVPYLRMRCRKSEIEKEENASLLKDQQWFKDYKLLFCENIYIYQEHLEMVLQYGMVTLFIAAFPLAPLCALINNIFEIRMDAKKLLTNYRRPVAQNVRSIEIWMKIMNLISELSVLTNACIIAFTSNLIPRLVYNLHKRKSYMNETFLDFSLSRIKISDFDIRSNIQVNISECRYPDYRNPPEHENKYDLSEIYWHIFTARLIFVLVFQNTVIILKWFIKWLVPEMPVSLKKRIVDEYKNTQRIIIEKENERRLT